MAGAMTRTKHLLTAPMLPAILGLAAPGVVLALFQTAVSIADTHFVGRLGTEALAGLALVFPLVMLLQMTSAGAMGGGVSSAVARALGAGDEDTARNLAAHALVIALVAGLAFAAVMLTFGPALYALLGGTGRVLDHALVYSHVLFGGAVLVWLANTLASILRGSGNTFFPAVALGAAAVAQIPLSGALTLGWHPLPRLGIAGAALAYAFAFGLAALLMGTHLWLSPLRPRSNDWNLTGRQFHEILRVGALSSVNSLQTVLTAVILTGFVGTFGTAALAGYGIGVRLELLQIPIVFAIGQALVVLVGTHIGAGLDVRARRIAWTGTAVAMAVTFTIGIIAAIFPAAWVRIFSDDPNVLEAASAYLRLVAPWYALLGAGMALYFASQGAGRMLLPMLAGTTRLAFVAAGGTLALKLSSSLDSLFAVIACGLVLFGVLTAIAVYRVPWGTQRAPLAAARRPADSKNPKIS